MIRSILEGEHVVLTILDEDADAEILSRWTHDIDYLIATSDEPVRPISTGQVKKQIQEWNKKKETFYPFGVRDRQDDQLVGAVVLRWIDWAHGNSHLAVYPGAPIPEHLPAAQEALDLVVRYGFEELNLFRISARLVEYNQSMVDLFLRAGFIEEVRRREARLRFGRRWDMIHVGLLAEEWRARQAAKEGAQS